MFDKKQLLNMIENNELFQTALSRLKSSEEQKQLKDLVSHICDELSNQSTENKTKDENNSSELLKQ